MFATNKKKVPTPDGFRAISLSDAVALFPRMMWLNKNPTLGFNIQLESSNIWLSADKTLIIKSGMNVWTFDGLSWTDEVQALKNKQLNKNT